MPDEIQELIRLSRKDVELEREILDKLEQAQLNQETLERLCKRQQWTEKILNGIYLITCDIREMLNTLLTILGSRLRKDSDKLNVLREELEKRALENGYHDLMEIKAGGDVSVDQSRKKVASDEKGTD